MNARTISRRTAVAAVAALAAAAAAPAWAQAGWPSQNLRIVVPQTAGGPSDVVGRLFATRLGESLGRTVIVENRPGAGGNIGTDLVAKSKPDGHTLLVNIVGILAINATLYRQMPFDAERDLDGIARVVSSQLALVAHPSVPVANVRELVAYVKSRPAGSISFASAGTGSPQHIGGELLNAKAGIKLNHVPYKGAVPALQDLLGGHVPLAIVGLPAVLQPAAAGQLKILGVFGGQRSPVAREVPTFVESGFPEIEMELAYGVYAAKGTPRPIVERLNRELGAVLQVPEVRERLAAAGFEIGHSSPAALDAYLKSEIAKWRPIVRDSGATPD
ncbi:MAG: hypothetical protein RI988_1741 [Pseudomonadota bacterium]|jgi:tripartite-type tricarboxylate transporter receptor subunit TctC